MLEIIAIMLSMQSNCVAKYDAQIHDSTRQDYVYDVLVVERSTGQIMAATSTDGDYTTYPEGDEYYGSPSPVADKLMSQLCGVRVGQTSERTVRP